MSIVCIFSLITLKEFPQQCHQVLRWSKKYKNLVKVVCERPLLNILELSIFCVKQ